MNQILINILATVVTCIVLPLISYLGIRLTQWLNNKIKDEKGQALIKQATDVVLNAVRSVFQTYVESLKKSGTFDKEAQVTALNLAKDIVLKQLNEDVKNYVKDNYGDLSDWITNQIESSINLLKN
ncbi:MAG: hypothetical protein LKE36_02265 [Bacilli bacterium]|jgi:predicted PurR-regulated permease PerM|nr:hypothetical protein [Bacilli bacterium]OQA78643.1 MAG: hypothetical protein BWY30_00575 [Tenericutes bacterium ADurb.Bin239]